MSHTLISGIILCLENFNDHGQFFNRVINLFVQCFFPFRSRKRRPSYSQDNDLYLSAFRDDDQMNECNAALVLMSLSGSPHSPRQWMLGSSPASNSSASWTSSGSDELSDEGVATSSHHHRNGNKVY